MCTYCRKIVEVDKEIANKLDEITAFCCKECSSVEPLIKEGE